MALLLLSVAAVIEATTGIALIISPQTVTSLLLGADLGVVGGGDVLRAQRVCAAGEAAILRGVRGDAAEPAEDQDRGRMARPSLRRWVRAGSFLIVGGQCAARRSDMVRVPFFQVRALVRG